MADGSETSNRKRKHGGGGGGNGFKALGLSDSIYRGIVQMGFRTPTPVQRKSLPVILSGVDTVVMARTGSGKTCAFLIPLLEKLLATPKGQNGNHVRGIILSPTRELSMQTLRVLHKLTASTLASKNNDNEDDNQASASDIRAIGIHGGEGMEKQFHLLASKPDVIVATPGRLAHHLSEIPDFTLGGCRMCILDEADRLLEMGFAMQIRQIARKLPGEQQQPCQKVLLSATMPKVLVEFTKTGFCVDPTMVRLDSEASVSAELRIAFITCRSLEKDAALLHVLQHIQQDKEANANCRTGLTLIFCATRHHCEYVTTLLTASGVSASMIYGSMDQEARRSNLAAFRSGNKPVLVVTDVAARGLDVPHLDHVIHYHFPPSPKLFVHRSGRAARAGRIGFCWGLVEPDELAYMIDLHLFLGRKPSTGTTSTSGSTADASDSDRKTSSDISKDELVYTLSEMTPEMVHYGALPESVLTEEVENVQRIKNSELSGSMDAQAMRSLTKVCTNAMKQYRRTRTEASREGLRRAKAILEGERLQTGQRVGGGAIPAHPLLRGMENKRQALLLERQGEKGGIAAAENVKAREFFLREMLPNFRPKETVFEAFATGGGKDVGVVSHLDKGRTTKTKKHDSSAALSAMKSMRRQMRMSRDKGTSLVVAGSANALELNGDEVPTDRRSDDESAGGDVEGEAPQAKASAKPALFPPPAVKQAPIEGKWRMSKAERRRLKKNPGAGVPDRSPSSQPKKEVKRDFRDPAFFIENDFTSSTEDAHRSRQIEAAMQPSASTTARGSLGTALRIEEAMLDIVGDENEEMVKKQRMMRWDKSKRKYVKTTVGDELSGDSKSKKMRLESGQLVKKDKAKLGELYAKWQKKTNRSVGRSGVFDDDRDGNEGALPVPTSGKNKKGKKSAPARSGDSSDRTRTALDIKKDRDRKQNLKIKNMKRGDRRQLEQKQREGKNAQARKEWNKSAPRKRR